jgi:hypothetical protein
MKTVTNATIPNSAGVRSLARMAPINMEKNIPLYLAIALYIIPDLSNLLMDVINLRNQKLH